MNVVLYLKKWKWLIVLAIPFVLVFIITGLNFPLLWDEGTYHIPGILVMRDSFPLFNIEQYNSATTPLFHIFHGTLFKLLGSKVIVVRIINSLLSLFTLMIFFKILKREKADLPLAKTFLLLFYPYFFILSFLAMTNVFALFFATCAIYFLDKPYDTRRISISALFMTLAILSRQTWIALPMGVLFFYLIENNFKLTKVIKHLKKISIFLIPILAYLPFLIIWKGTVPQEFQNIHPNYFSLKQLNFFLVILGAYFWPYFFLNKVKIKKNFFYFLFPALFIFFAFRVDIGCHGILCSGIRSISNYLGSDLIYHFLMISLFLIGVLVMYSFFSNEYNQKPKLYLSILFSLLFLSLLSSHNWQRYSLELIPLLILIFFSKTEKSRKLFFVWVFLNIIMTSTYFFYKIYIQKL